MKFIHVPALYFIQVCSFCLNIIHDICLCSLSRISNDHFKETKIENVNSSNFQLLTLADACHEQYSQDKFIQLSPVKSSWIISYDKVLTGNPVGPVHEIYNKDLVSIRDNLLGDCILFNFTVTVIVIAPVRSTKQKQQIYAVFSEEKWKQIYLVLS
ncbi:hypothetical protein Peur_028324 [Populus x canadensis]